MKLLTDISLMIIFQWVLMVLLFESGISEGVFCIFVFTLLSIVISGILCSSRVDNE